MCRRAAHPVAEVDQSLLERGQRAAALTELERAVGRGDRAAAVVVVAGGSVVVVSGERSWWWLRRRRGRSVVVGASVVTVGPLASVSSRVGQGRAQPHARRHEHDDRPDHNGMRGRGPTCGRSRAASCGRRALGAGAAARAGEVHFSATVFAPPPGGAPAQPSLGDQWSVSNGGLRKDRRCAIRHDCRRNDTLRR